MKEQYYGATQHWKDSKGGIILNESGLSLDSIGAALHDQHPELAALVRWGNAVAPNRSGSLFERDRYVSPHGPYEQMRTAYFAAINDDIVSGVIETSEALAFSHIDFEADDPDQENIWNQWADEMDLMAHLKEIWRELFTVSQCYVCVYWGRKSYKVRGASDNGVKRKKSYDLRVPIGISLLDPLKVLPVGQMLFGQERLAYIATRSEAVDFLHVLAGDNTTDLLVQQLIEGPYEATEAEKTHFGDIGIDYENLFLLNDKMVWRLTDTKPAYERFANVRMRSVFELLDLKQQLKSMDRAHLLGATNFILLVKKGTDELPARPAEITQLAEQVRMNSRIPVIVGDHRIEIEIITPKTDNTLKPERYNALDGRIEARLFGMFFTGNYAAGAKGDDSIKLAKVVARGLETRRDAIAGFLQRNIFDRIVELNSSLTADANLHFHPKRIAIDFDPAVATLLQVLRDRGDISRESILDELGFDQDDEARKRLKEAKDFDKIFTPTNVPFDSPTKTTKPGTGATGGTNPASHVPNSTSKPAAK